MILKTRFVAPVDRPVIENGAVVVEGGRIVAIGAARELADRSAIDCGDAVICPGFVNAHTHLELTHLAGRFAPSSDFIQWLRQIYAASISLPATEDHVATAVAEGIRRSLAAGVTTVGDITRHPNWTRPVLKRSPLRALSLGEIIAIGRRRGLLTERLQAAASREHESSHLQVGISPHSPYTVEPDGLSACARTLNQEAGAEHPTYRLCIHAAETKEEDSFTRFGTGPLADYLRELQIWDAQIPIGGCGPIELLERTGLLTPHTMLAHANYVSDSDIDMISRSHVSVAYCPRTHLAFCHEPNRFCDMLAAGINVAIGTDSLASNPDLSVLGELQFLHQTYPEVPLETLLRMGTLNGAKALGFEYVVGSISPGKDADLVVIELGASCTSWVGIFNHGNHIRRVYVRGERVEVH